MQNAKQKAFHRISAIKAHIHGVIKFCDWTRMQTRFPKFI